MKAILSVTEKPSRATPLSARPWSIFPNPKKLELLIDGESLDFNENSPLSYNRILDLQKALLKRKIRCRSRKGKIFLIESERFVSAQNKKSLLSPLPAYGGNELPCGTLLRL